MSRSFYFVSLRQVTVGAVVCIGDVVRRGRLLKIKQKICFVHKISGARRRRADTRTITLTITITVTITVALTVTVTVTLTVKS